MAPWAAEPGTGGEAPRSICFEFGEGWRGEGFLSDLALPDNVRFSKGPRTGSPQGSPVVGWGGTPPEALAVMLEMRPLSRKITVEVAGESSVGAGVVREGCSAEGARWGRQPGGH